jgi:hypothetical protein
MGVDVEMRLAEKIYVPQDKIDRFRAAFPDPSRRHPDDPRYPDLLPDGHVRCMDRLFDFGYARGHWPAIRRMIMWLRSEFGQDVCYGGDHVCDADSDNPADWPPIVTDEHLAELDALWEALPKDEDGYSAITHWDIGDWRPTSEAPTFPWRDQT